MTPVEAARLETFHRAIEGRDAFKAKWGKWGEEAGMDPDQASKLAQEIIYDVETRTGRVPTDAEVKFQLARIRQGAAAPDNDATFNALIDAISKRDK